MIKLFIDHGYNFRKKNTEKFLKMFEMLIDAGADTTIFINDDDDDRGGYDFYDILDNMTKIKSLKKNILNIIKNKKPDQYNYYLAKKKYYKI